MTILTIDRKEIERRVEKVTSKLEKRITNMGTPSGFLPQVVGGRSLSLVGGRLNVALCGARGKSKMDEEINMIGIWGKQ